MSLPGLYCPDHVSTNRTASIHQVWWDHFSQSHRHKNVRSSSVPSQRNPSYKSTAQRRFRLLMRFIKQTSKQVSLCSWNPYIHAYTTSSSSSSSSKSRRPTGGAAFSVEPRNCSSCCSMSTNSVALVGLRNRKVRKGRLRQRRL